MGGVGGREGNAGEATEVNSNAGFDGGEDARCSMTAINGEKADGVGVGIFDLTGRRVSSLKFCPLRVAWNPRQGFKEHGATQRTHSRLYIFF